MKSYMSSYFNIDWSLHPKDYIYRWSNLRQYILVHLKQRFSVFLLINLLYKSHMLLQLFAVIDLEK
jgi:hypothetical protein